MKKNLIQKLLLVLFIALSIALIVVLSIVLKGPDYTHNYKGKVSCIVCVTGNPVELSETDQANILKLMNNGEWEYDVVNCGYDYIFTVENKKIFYQSELGNLNDGKDFQHKSLSDDEREFLNAILLDGVS
ncbi:MAG: hypothetical protein E7634_03920 [Ruminococcaceae bacterium]|nr:hypothetical protein [Oscillospiraceae bacterium]